MGSRPLGDLGWQGLHLPGHLVQLVESRWENNYCHCMFACHCVCHCTLNPDQEFQWNCPTPTKHPDSASPPYQSSPRYLLSPELSTKLSTKLSPKLSHPYQSSPQCLPSPKLSTMLVCSSSKCIFFLKTLYFADQTLELFHGPKPQHKESLLEYRLCK